VSGYPVSTLAVRMAVLIRMTERGLTREEPADLAGMTLGCVLEAGLPSSVERHVLPWRSAGRLAQSPDQ
jgi:hypothetical protein